MRTMPFMLLALSSIRSKGIVARASNQNHSFR